MLTDFEFCVYSFPLNHVLLSPTHRNWAERNSFVLGCKFTLTSLLVLSNCPHLLSKGLNPSFVMRNLSFQFILPTLAIHLFMLSVSCHEESGNRTQFFGESSIFWIFKSHLKNERSKKALLIFYLHIMLEKNGEYGVFF